MAVESKHILRKWGVSMIYYILYERWRILLCWELFTPPQNQWVYPNTKNIDRDEMGLSCGVQNKCKIHYQCCRV